MLIAYPEIKGIGNLIKLFSRLFVMAKKSSNYGKNIYLSTTIFAIIGTILYSLIVYFFYPGAINVYYILIFFAIVWAVYYWIAKNKRNY